MVELTDGKHKAEQGLGKIWYEEKIYMKMEVLVCNHHIHKLSNDNGYMMIKEGHLEDFE